MNPLEIFLPVEPLPVIINQGFGVNPLYYSKMGIIGHNGIDLNAQHGQPVYCPFDGIAAYMADSHGGDGIYLKTFDKRDYKTGQNRFMCLLWHLCSKDDSQFPIQIKADGSWNKVKVGQLLGYADNTGAPYESSGDHLHLGLYPLNDIDQFLEPDNGFRGAIDPAPYLSHYSAKQFSGFQGALFAIQQTWAKILANFSKP